MDFYIFRHINTKQSGKLIVVMLIIRLHSMDEQCRSFRCFRSSSSKRTHGRNYSFSVHWYRLQTGAKFHHSTFPHTQFNRMLDYSLENQLAKHAFVESNWSKNNFEKNTIRVSLL